MFSNSCPEINGHQTSQTSPNQESCSLPGMGWVLRLRDLTLFGQFASTLYFLKLQGATQHFFILLLVTTIAIGGHVCLKRAFSNGALMTQRTLPLILLLDSALHSSLLAISGGAANPFTVLFITQVVVSAVVLPVFWALLLTAWSGVCFGALLLLVPSRHAMHHTFDTHLYGMWVAYIFTSIAVAYAIAQVIAQQRQQDANIKRLERIQAQHSKLASLATLSAGAAHEIANPLGTIALVAHELKNASQISMPTLQSELSLIESEIDRCRLVLDQMKSKGGLMLKEAPQQMSAKKLHLKIQQECSIDSRIVITSSLKKGAYSIQTENLVTSVLALLDNALFASTKDVTVRLFENDSHWSISVEDHGCGIPAPTLTAIRDPFFSTKNPGEGMGLGLFLVETFVHEQNGRLEIASIEGQGTLMTMHFPQLLDLQKAV